MIRTEELNNGRIEESRVARHHSPVRQLLSSSFLFFLTACATTTAEHDQAITVTTEPPGASCAVKNNEITLTIAATPATVRVPRSFSTLAIYCSHPDFGTGEQMIEAKTRGRAWGNLLLFGMSAAVDATTGAGYEYAPSAVTIPLTPEELPEVKSTTKN